MVKWLALATVVCACATTTAANGSAGADREQTSDVTGHDADHDGLSDAVEIRRYHTDPRKQDTDRDGLSDGAEVRRYKTNPRERDTDGDGYGDRAELRAGHKPSPPPQSSRIPRQRTTRCAAPDGAVGVHRSSTISTPNTEVDGKTMGCIQVTRRVVIRNSKISCAASYAILSG